MRFQHHRRSEKHHTPTKVDGHFWSGLNEQYRVSLNKLNYPKRPDHAFFFYLSVGHVGADVLTRGKLWAWGNPNLTTSDFHIFQTFPKNSFNSYLNRWHAHCSPPMGAGQPPMLLSWHQLPIQQPFESVPMSHLDVVAEHLRNYKSINLEGCPHKNWVWSSPVLSLPVAVHWANTVTTIPFVDLEEVLMDMCCFGLCWGDF